MAWSKTKQGQYINKDLYGDKVFGYNAARNLQGFDKYIKSQKKAAKGSGKKETESARKIRLEKEAGRKERSAYKKDLIKEYKSYISDQSISISDKQWAERQLQLLNDADVSAKGATQKLKSFESGLTKRFEISTLTDDTPFSNQKVVTEAGDTVPFLNAQEVQASNSISGGDWRNKVEASRVNTDFDLKAKAWNKHISEAADELEKRGKFSNPDGSPRMSAYRRTAYVGGENPDFPSVLTAKEEWILSRQLDYGHLGAASNPSWRYAINWKSNAGPEFSLYNRSESMSESIYDALATDQALRKNKGLTWSQGNKRRFDKILKELSDEGLSPKFNLGYFNDMPTREMAPVDLARSRAHSILASGGVPDDQLLMSGITPSGIIEGRRSNFGNVGQDGAGSILLLNQSLPTADTESVIAGNKRWLNKNAVRNASSPDNIIDIVKSATPEQLEQFKKDVVRAGKELRVKGAGLTPSNITRALQSVGGASTLMLLSNIARADGEGGVEKFINGLNWMETQTNQGDEAISNIPGVQAVKDIWSGLTSFLDNNVDTVNVGPGGAIEMPVENVGQSLDAAQNVVNPYWDVAALTGAFMPDQPQDVVTEQQPYYTGTGFQSIDEHDAKVNRGLVRNIWTNDD